MGADQSDIIENVYLTAKITKEVTDYINGKIKKDSLRYIFFLMNANGLINLDDFFAKVDIHKIGEYIGDLGVIEMKEAKTIIQKILQVSSCDEKATYNLQIILPKMRIKFNDSYICPLYSKDLFNQLFKTEYKTGWGKYIPTTSINWNSQDIISNYQMQKQQTLQQIYQDLYQLNYYVKTKNTELTNCISCPVLHSDDLSSVVTLNYVEKLLENNVCQIHQGVVPFKKKVSRPNKWLKNIHNAALNGDEQSLVYCLYLLPILLNCPDKKGNTPAHVAACGDRGNIIKVLSSFGADFHRMNNDGLFPHHLASGKNSILAFNSIGVDLNERDGRGNSLLELRTRDFDMNAIETLLGVCVDIFTPNLSGVYWMQLAIHDEFYKNEMSYSEFQRRVRRILQKSTKKDIFKNEIAKEILERQSIYFEEEDIEDINESFTKRDMNRIITLLALGANADHFRQDGKTNLMLCAERNDFQMAEILLNNFCNPNFKNEKGENAFWIASYLMNFNTATVLRNHGANVNEISSSGETILHVAYRERNMDLFKYLLDCGCNPNIKNKNEETVLFQAYCAKDDEIAELIQNNYNGDINVKGQDGNSLAHVALLEKDPERLDYYISRGIDIEIKNDYGYTIFMISITMFDDLQLCLSLLNHGADINTQDANGNTALLNILHSKKFNRSKFDFLINNNCNINIKNEMGEYPISVCIIHELNEEAQMLLDRNCIIHDTESEFEPIANALKVNSQHWFEALLERGSTASNTRYPVLASYISSNFFYFDLMKKFPSMNVVLGGPILAAIRKGYKEVADYLWETSDEQTKYDIAKTPDIYGMIPLSAAIVYDSGVLVNKLLSENYELMLPDSNNRTAFSYACQVNQTNWMEIIFSRITPENANLVDNIGNSALTYTACNKNIHFCNFLFENNIKIFDINEDHNGIIELYREIVNKHQEYKSIAYDNAKAAEQLYDKCNKEVSRLTIKLHSRCFNGRPSYPAQTNVASDLAEGLYNLFDAMVIASIEDELNVAKNKRDRARLTAEKYRDRYLRIKSMTRSDLIKNFSLIVSSAKNDGDIPRSKRSIDPNFDVQIFLCKIDTIIGDSQ